MKGQVMGKVLAEIGSRHLIDALRFVEMARIENHIPLLSVAVARFGDRAELVATDLDQEMIVPIEAKYDEPFEAVIHPPTAITAFGSGSGNVTIRDCEGSHQISCEQITLNCPTDIDPSDFPCPEIGQKKAEFTIGEGDLCDAINSVRFAISTEETRYYLERCVFHGGGREVDVGCYRWPSVGAIQD